MRRHTLWERKADGLVSSKIFLLKVNYSSASFLVSDSGNAMNELAHVINLQAAQITRERRGALTQRCVPSSERGAIAIMIAVLLPVILGILGPPGVRIVVASPDEVKPYRGRAREIA